MEKGEKSAGSVTFSASPDNVDQKDTRDVKQKKKKKKKKKTQLKKMQLR
jgi:hypothetical protein